MKQLKMMINAGEKLSHINAEIYGHFSEHLGSCIYDGIYVGEDSDIPNTCGIRNDVIEAFKQIKVPVLRWPGGCFAEEYHWRDGIGEKSKRPKRINSVWGCADEDNSFGTHEFLTLCELVGCEPYIAVNLGSGTVQEMSEWVEYMTSDLDTEVTRERRKNGREKPWRIKYLGIGNENWGGGGCMRPEFYADEYRRYQCFCKNYGGSQLYKIACGPNGLDTSWSEKLLEIVGADLMNGFSLHYYTVPTGDWAKKGSARDFTDEEYYKTVCGAQHIEKAIEQNKALMQKHDPSGRVKLVIDEWGNWYDVEEGTNPAFLYQQNSMRDAITAACNLNIFNRHSDVISMANIAQAVNVLQSVLLTKGEKLVKTPTFYVFDLFKNHQNAELVDSHCENEYVSGARAISQSASLKDGVLTVTLANCSLESDYEITCSLSGITPKSARARLISGKPTACNDFDNADNVTPGECEVTLSEDGFSINLPKCSVVAIEIK